MLTATFELLKKHEIRDMPIDRAQKILKLMEYDPEGDFKICSRCARGGGERK